MNHYYKFLFGLQASPIIIRKLQFEITYLTMNHKLKPSSVSYLNQFFTPSHHPSTNYYLPQHHKRQKTSQKVQNNKSQFQIPLLNLSCDQKMIKNSTKRVVTPQCSKHSNATYKIRHHNSNELQNSILQQFEANLPVNQPKQTNLQNQFMVQDIFKKVDDQIFNNKSSDIQKKCYLQEQNKNLKQYNHFLVNQIRTFSKKYKKYKELYETYKIVNQNLKKNLNSTIKSYQFTAIQIIDKLQSITSQGNIKTQITQLLVPYIKQKISPEIIKNQWYQTQQLKTQPHKEEHLNLLNSIGSPYFKASQQIKEGKQEIIGPVSILVNTEENVRQQQKNQLAKLNEQFQINMKKYRQTKDIGYRKSCIGIASKIKQLKAVDETIRTVQKSMKKNATVSNNLLLSKPQNEMLRSSEQKKLANWNQKHHPRTVGHSLTSFVSEIMDEDSINLLQKDDLYNYQHKDP